MLDNLSIKYLFQRYKLLLFTFLFISSPAFADFLDDMPILNQQSDHIVLLESNSGKSENYVYESNFLVSDNCSYSELLSHYSNYCWKSTNKAKQDYSSIFESIDYSFSHQQIATYQALLNSKAKFTIADPNLLKNRQQSFNSAHKILSIFLTQNPELQSSIESAAGYGLFETTSFNLLLYAGGWGDGMVFDNVDKNVIYVDTARAGTGLGLGYITEYTLIIFHKHYAIEQYFGAEVGGDVGASGTIGIWSRSVSFNPAISTYRIYHYGANIQANWGATVYWVSPLLN